MRGDVSKKRLLGHAEKHKAESQLAHPRKYHNRCVETQRRCATSVQSITMSAPRAHQEIMSLFVFAFTGTRWAAACTAHFCHCCYPPHRTRGLPRKWSDRSFRLSVYLSLSDQRSEETKRAFLFGSRLLLASSASFHHRWCSP